MLDDAPEFPVVECMTELERFAVELPFRRRLHRGESWLELTLSIDGSSQRVRMRIERSPGGRLWEIRDNVHDWRFQRQHPTDDPSAFPRLVRWARPQFEIARAYYHAFMGEFFRWSAYQRPGAPSPRVVPRLALLRPDADDSA